jgi:hypothetical protein
MASHDERQKPLGRLASAPRERLMRTVCLKALRGDFGLVGPGPKNPDDLASDALMAARL